MGMITILLVDDDHLVREGISGLLASQNGMKIIGSVASAEEAMDFLQQHPVDIILLDLNMPGLGGFEATKKMSRQYPRSKIIILTVSKSETLPKHLLQAGAKGYLTKGCDIHELSLAIQQVAQGRHYISNELSQQIALSLQHYDQSPFEQLSPRELQIVIMLLHGMKLTEIAHQLKISVKTISTHKTRVYEKLNLENDMQLFKLAIRHQIVQAD